MAAGIDWDRPDWGGHVTHASNGSWVHDETDEEDRAR